MFKYLKLVQLIIITFQIKKEDNILNTETKCSCSIEETLKGKQSFQTLEMDRNFLLSII